jgi:hypothetical protein
VLKTLDVLIHLLVPKNDIYAFPDNANHDDDDDDEIIFYCLIKFPVCQNRVRKLQDNEMKIRCRGPSLEGAVPAFTRRPLGHAYLFLSEQSSAETRSKYRPDTTQVLDRRAFMLGFN